MSEVNLLTFGEPLVMFASQDLNLSLTDSTHFRKLLAGAELNVAIAAKRLGIGTEYVTSVGNDLLGIYIKKSISELEIGTHYCYTDETHQSGFYFKQRVSQGDPSVYYYRNNTAAANFSQNFLEDINFTGVKALHVTGIFAATSSNNFKVIQKLLSLAKAKNIISFFDPNIRLPLWDSKELMVESLNSLAQQAEIVLPGISEGKLLTGLKKPSEIADFYLKYSNRTRLVVIKLGSKGAYFKNINGNQGYISGFQPPRVVDTVGAGDGFAAGLISGIIENLSIEQSVARACAIGALAVSSASDNGGYPTRFELERFMEKVNEN
ncbi:sugar kinase [Lactobacillus sp. UCMA15818]|uniref:sugar kinase n=1 Tax=Lactobacillus sp. UCMA15818 TaxID=2583394 RepID=UPI0025B0C666|nr:sugar kinase [Lactobacillus sp. UCMA15818]MDN2453154.1 sugar kinase [Lactobacillus sp. UCMA15818]